MDISWEDARLFLAVAEAGSLSAAARALALGQPTVSRRLAELEEALGYRLFKRGVRGAALTASGERLLEPSRKMAEWAGELSRVAARGEGAPRGLVRLTAPPGIASEVVAPFAARLRRSHPQLRLEVRSSMAYLDLARGEADLALRVRPPTDRALTVLRTIRHRIQVWAARDYARRLPRRAGLADLDWIAWAPPYDGLPPTPQLQALIPDFQPVFTSDDILIQWRAAEEGVGAMATGSGPHRFARNSRLVPLDFDLGPHGVAQFHLVGARRALELPRVRAVADALLAYLPPGA
jgi:DNA-binding transcriptional LysR family regulator